MSQYGYRKNSFLDDPEFHVKPPRTGAGGSGPRKPQKKRGMSVAAMIVIDVLLAALLLLVFYLTNYVFHGETEPIESLPKPSWLTSESPETSPIESAVVSSETAASTDTAAAATPTATIDPNDWRAKFADKFTGGEVEKTDTSYRSANISVTIEKMTKDNVTCYVADIYIAELKYFKTAFAVKTDTMGHTEHTNVIAQENNAVIAINGDYCLNNKDTGVVIRNGQPYAKNNPSKDQLVMFYDGTMKAYSPEEFDYDTVTQAGAYQVWSWGPMLLQGGQPMTEFNSTVNKANPRTAIGYYEPGHYCFVVVDGRSPQPTDGMTTTQLSQLFYDLKCQEAYNMDGGQTSEMAFSGEFVNQPYKGGRSCSDIIYIGE